MEVHSPKNEKRIDEVYVFLSVDPDGTNGICGGVMAPLGNIQLVTANEKIADEFKRIAAVLSMTANKRIIMAKFARGEEMWSVG